MLPRYDHMLDLNKVYTNDIHQMVSYYGIEAAVQVIIRVRKVFNYSYFFISLNLLLMVALLCCVDMFVDIEIAGCRKECPLTLYMQNFSEGT